jgi:hypothetical protein
VSRSASGEAEAPVELLVGPLLRYVGTSSATIWVETSAAAIVEVLGKCMSTFHVEGHHYALVLIEDLEPGTETSYDVRLNDRVVWPYDDGRPPSVIRTRHGERRLRLAFGSCRVGGPEPPVAPSSEAPKQTFDALRVYARQLIDGSAAWPDGLVLLGDQVYADEVSPETAAFIRSRRDTSKPPGREVADFEEYTRLYRESWSEPDIRWLLSTVPSTMIFDDHDVHDDWNLSQAWVEHMRAQPWWDDRIVGAFMAYWLYQHLGNQSPPELAEDDLYRDVLADEDAGPRLREFAHRGDRESAASRWAYYRDFGDSRLLVIDSRAARVLAGGQREMVDEAEWDWIIEHARGSFDHLILASTLPVFMAPGIHHLEAWNEAVCSGCWGSLAAWLGERLRRAVDLDHWPAFQQSFERFVALLGDISKGKLGPPPATISIVGGDIHSSYIAEVSLGADSGSSRVHQIVCSPFRNPLSRRERTIVRVTGSRVAARMFSALSRLSGVPRPSAAWAIREGPVFSNCIGELVMDGREARVTIRSSTRSGDAQVDLRTEFSRTLASFGALIEHEGPQAGAAVAGVRLPERRGG